MAQFNRHPNVSANRLKRVKTSQSRQNEDSPGIEQDMVGLYDDCAITNKEVPDGFSLVQITRMRKKGQSRGYIEHRDPIPLNKLSEFSNVEIIVCTRLIERHIRIEYNSRRDTNIQFKVSNFTCRIYIYHKMCLDYQVMISRPLRHAYDFI